MRSPDFGQRKKHECREEEGSGRRKEVSPKWVLCLGVCSAPFPCAFFEEQIERGMEISFPVLGYGVPHAVPVWRGKRAETERLVEGSRGSEEGWGGGHAMAL